MFTRILDFFGVSSRESHVASENEERTPLLPEHLAIENNDYLPPIYSTSNPSFSTSATVNPFDEVFTTHTKKTFKVAFFLIAAMHAEGEKKSQKIKALAAACYFDEELKNILHELCPDDENATHHFSHKLQALHAEMAEVGEPVNLRPEIARSEAEKLAILYAEYWYAKLFAEKNYQLLGCCNYRPSGILHRGYSSVDEREKTALDELKELLAGESKEFNSLMRRFDIALMMMILITVALPIGGKLAGLSWLHVLAVMAGVGFVVVLLAYLSAPEKLLVENKSQPWEAKIIHHTNDQVSEPETPLISCMRIVRMGNKFNVRRRNSSSNIVRELALHFSHGCAALDPYNRNCFFSLAYDDVNIFECDMKNGANTLERVGWLKYSSSVRQRKI